MVAFSGLVVITQNTPAIGNESQAVLEGVPASAQGHRHLPDQDLDKKTSSRTKLRILRINVALAIFLVRSLMEPTPSFARSKDPR